MSLSSALLMIDRSIGCMYAILGLICEDADQSEERPVYPRLESIASSPSMRLSTFVAIDYTTNTLRGIKQPCSDSLA